MAAIYKAAVAVIFVIVNYETHFPFFIPAFYLLLVVCPAAKGSGR